MDINYYQINLNSFSNVDLKEFCIDCDFFLNKGFSPEGSKLRLLNTALGGNGDLLSLQHTVFIIYREIERRYWDLFSTVGELLEAIDKDKEEKPDVENELD